MFEKMKKIELSQDELDMIEAALHTQSQILNVEVSAGGVAARTQLNGVKRLLSMLDQHKAASQPTEKVSGGCGWWGMTRRLG